MFLLDITKVQLVSDNSVSSLALPLLTVFCSVAALLISGYNLATSIKERKALQERQAFNFELIAKNPLFDLADERFHIFLTFINLSSEPIAVLDLQLSTGRPADSRIPDDSNGNVGGSFINEKSEIYKTIAVNPAAPTHWATKLISKELPIVIPGNSAVGGYFSFSSGAMSSHILFERGKFNIKIKTTNRDLSYKIDLHVFPESEQNVLINEKH